MVPLPVTVFTAPADAVPDNVTPASVNPVTASPNTTVNRSGDVFAGSAWPAAWLIETGMPGWAFVVMSNAPAIPPMVIVAVTFVE